LLCGNFSFQMKIVVLRVVEGVAKFSQL